MPVKFSFHKQDHWFSCVPACVRMVLESFDIFQPEAYLRHLLECDESGTSPSKVVKAVREHFGLMKSRISRLTLDALREEILGGLYPIVYLDLLEQGLQNLHVVIVIEISEIKVHVVDPYYDENDGFRTFDLTEFNHAWMVANSRTIIIE